MTEVEQEAAPKQRRSGWSCCLAGAIVLALLLVLFVVWLALAALNRSTY